MITSKKMYRTYLERDCRQLYGGKIPARKLSDKTSEGTIKY